MIIEKLCQQSGLSENYFLHLADTANQRYKNYSIKKRNGKDRQIFHPSKRLKAVQRWLVDDTFSKFPVHTCATAYEPGSSIKKNALLHCKSNYSQKFDFKGFFPSLTANSFRKFLNEHTELLDAKFDSSDTDFICAICFLDGRLTIGAPSSPKISNFMLYDFDTLMLNHCLKENLIYSRYADDITVSSDKKNCLMGVQTLIQDCVKEVGYLSLELNKSKSASLSRKYHRRITGITIGSDRSISIGRARKRMIKALVHRYSNGNLEKDKINHLRGLISFWVDVEPNAVKRLEAKYGKEVLDKLMDGDI